MTDTIVWEKSKVEVPREGAPYYRPLIKSLENLTRLVPYSRPSSYGKPLDDRTQLEKWLQRKLARGLTKQDELLLRVASMGDIPGDDGDGDRAWKRKLNELCELAIKADGSDRNKIIGDALHHLTETNDLGLPLGSYPAEWHPHIENYREATANFEMMHVEPFVVCDEMKLAGSPDRIMRVPGCDKLIIGDVKTGSDYGAASWAIQLACYAHSKLYDPATGQRTDAGEIDQDRGLIILLNQKTAEVTLQWLDIGAGWASMDLIKQVKSWRAKRSWLTPYIGQGAGAQDLVAEAQANLVQAIVSAESPDALVKLWRRAGSVWADEHTGLAAQRKAELLGMQS